MDFVFFGGVGIVIVFAVRHHRKRKVAAEEEKQRVSLEGISVSVFIQQPDNSRINLECHIEQELLSRGALVFVADRGAGESIVSLGKFQPLSPDANTSFVGTLVIRENVEVIKEAETGHEFNLRLAQWEADIKGWKEAGKHYNDPKPVLRPRRGEPFKYFVNVIQLSFQLMDSQGSLLASGNIEKIVDAGEPTHNVSFRGIAKKALDTLDDNNVWNSISVRSLASPTA